MEVAVVMEMNMLTCKLSRFYNYVYTFIALLGLKLSMKVHFDLGNEQIHLHDNSAKSDDEAPEKISKWTLSWDGSVKLFLSCLTV